MVKSATIKSVAVAALIACIGAVAPATTAQAAPKNAGQPTPTTGLVATGNTTTNGWLSCVILRRC